MFQKIVKMKFFLYSFALLFLNSCQTKDINENCTNTNLLLDKDITVFHHYSETYQQQMPWTTNFKIPPFINLLFNKFFQNKISLYDPVYEDTVFKELDKNTLLYILKNNKQLAFDTSQFNDILFFESWHLDTNEIFNLQKKVIYWSPIKRDSNTYKLAGKIKCNTNNSTLLAHQIKYEFPINDTISPFFYFENDRLNKKKLVKILLDWSVKNPTKTYNPFTTEKLTKKELNNRLNNSDSLFYLPYNDINSLLFVENWYYDTISFSISKELLSVAPIVYTYDSTEVSKRILFVIYLKNKPTKIF